jgi:hypothetical protein
VLTNSIIKFLQNTIEVFQKYYILIFKFDKKFYLACNPDVRDTDTNPIQHFIKYGFLEERIYSLEDCDTNLIDVLNLKKYHHLFNLTLMDMGSKLFNLSIVLIPWTPGCFGRPFQFMQVRISNSILKSNIILDSSIILYSKKGIFERVFLLKL